VAQIFDVDYVALHEKCIANGNGSVIDGVRCCNHSRANAWSLLLFLFLFLFISFSFSSSYSFSFSSSSFLFLFLHLLFPPSRLLSDSSASLLLLLLLHLGVVVGMRGFLIVSLPRTSVPPS